jgi:Ni,Fe-hydrogenase maturation factor
MMHILCFGNPYLKDDSLAIQIADHFAANPVKDIEFIKCVAPDEVLNYIGKDFCILDVVKDLKEPRLFDNIDQLVANNLVSLHDFDLGFFLKLMKETGRIDKVRIIGIPMDATVAEVKEKVLGLIRS